MNGFFVRQLISTLVGFVGMFSIMYLPSRYLRVVSIGIYVLAIILLGAVLGIGTSIYGTKGWLRLGSLSFQPAELGKLGVVMMLAVYLSSKGTDIRNIRTFAIASAIVLVPAMLIKLQPDDGSATVLLAIFMGILFWAGFNHFILYFIISLPILIITALKGPIFFGIALAIFSLIAIIIRKNWWMTIFAICSYVAMGIIAPIIYSHLMDHQRARIDTFLNPGADPRGSGYNVIQSLLAVGSGGLTGKGFMHGTQTQLRYIPMQWTDFIYSVPAEEFGFIGGLIVLLLFAYFIRRSIKVAYEVDNKFSSIVVVGAATMFMYHVVINIGMAIGLMPVMGIPLPFMSYGGTSMLINLAFVGLILNSWRNYKIKRIVS